LVAEAGATFARVVRLKEGETPFLFSGYTIKFVIVGVKELTLGDGLTLNEDEDELTVVVTDEETLAAANNATLSTRYYLSIEKGGTRSFVLRGAFTINQP
jgi:hypothetical protein